MEFSMELSRINIKVLKKIVCIFLTVLMTVTALGNGLNVLAVEIQGIQEGIVAEFAAYSDGDIYTDGDTHYTEGDVDIYNYTVSGGKATIISVNVTLDGISTVIPDKIDGYTVVAIGEDAFAGNNLGNVTVPDSITSIGARAFWACEIKNVTIGNGVTVIGDGAFALSSIESIAMGKKVKTIGKGVFNYCNNLIGITVDSDNAYYSNSANGVLFNKNKTELIRFPEKNGIKDYTIPDSVTAISDYAFSWCSGLKKVTIGTAVTSIGEGAFNSCPSITDVYYDGTMRQWNQIAISDGNEDLLGALFHFGATDTDDDGNDNDGGISDDGNINYYSYTVTNGKATITDVDEAISGNVVIPDALGGYPVVAIGEYAFYNCDRLTSVTMGNNVKTIDEGAFYFCNNLISIKIGKNVTAIGDFAFCYCSALAGIIIPDGVKTIGEWAFWDCTSLTAVSIPDSLTKIGYGTFSFCTGIKDVYYSGTEKQWKNIEIEDDNDYLTDATIHWGDCSHKNATFRTQTDSTCTQTGYTAGEYCSDCEIWLSGHEIIPTKPHDYYWQIVTYATHQSQGLKKFICDDCGDNYTEAIPKLEEHSYTSAITLEPTHLTQGVRTYTCVCGVSYTEIVAKLADHTYEKTTTAPDCTSQGYTTYTCACGSTYVGDYVNAKGHSYSATTVQPTCTQNGYINSYCTSCGDTYSETIEKAEHNFSGSVCIDCGYDRGVDCSCKCHETGIRGIIWNILKFFYKVFKKNPVCACGKAHY